MTLYMQLFFFFCEVKFMKKIIMSIEREGDIIHMPLKNEDASALSLKPSFHNLILQRTTN